MKEQIQEQEMGMRDYINIIIRRRNIVLGVFIGTLIIATISALLTPKNYEVSIIIEPAILGITEDGNPRYLNSVQNIKAKIEGGIFNDRIKKALNLPASETLKFKASQFKDSSFMSVSIEEDEMGIESGIKVMKQLHNELSNEYKPILESKKSAIEKQNLIFSNRIITKKDEIKLQEERLNLLEQREKELSDEINKIQPNINGLRDALFNKGSQIDNLASSFYMNTIQQNISYLNMVNNQFIDLKAQKAQITALIKKLQEEIENFQIEIDKANLKKENIQNIKLLREIGVSPVSTRFDKKERVTVFGFLGLLAGMAFALFIEYFSAGQK